MYNFYEAVTGLRRQQQKKIDTTKWDKRFLTPLQLKIVELREQGLHRSQISAALQISRESVASAIGRANKVQENWN